MQKPKIVVILGPTSVGKTSLSIELAKAAHGEVVSADSRQVYRGLDIGSGKVTQAEMEEVPHFMLDVADPKEVFTAADFVDQGRKVITDILNRKKVPIVVGGTGFYIDALVGKISLADVPADEKLRSELSGLSVKMLQERLGEIDPDALQRVDIQNPVRMVRAIEVATALGKFEIKESELLYDVLWIGLTLPQDELKEKIQARLLARLSEGMLDEAKNLHTNGLSYERMEQLGLEYRFMARHLSGNISHEEMIEQLKTEIGKYAKRQMTWFKRNKDIQWFKPNQTEDVKERVKDFLK